MSAPGCWRFAWTRARPRGFGLGGAIFSSTALFLRRSALGIEAAEDGSAVACALPSIPATLRCWAFGLRHHTLRVGLDACLAGSGDVSTPLTRPYRFRRRLVPVRGVHVYGMDMGCAVWWEANSGGDSARQREGTEGTRTCGHSGTPPTKCQPAGGSGLSRSLYRFGHLLTSLPLLS